MDAPKPHRKTTTTWEEWKITLTTPDGGEYTHLHRCDIATLLDEEQTIGFLVRDLTQGARAIIWQAIAVRIYDRPEQFVDRLFSIVRKALR